MGSALRCISRKYWLVLLLAIGGPGQAETREFVLFQKIWDAVGHEFTAMPEVRGRHASCSIDLLVCGRAESEVHWECLVDPWSREEKCDVVRTDHRIYLYCSPEASDDRCAQHVGHELAHILAHQSNPTSNASSHDAQNPCSEDELRADREGRRLAERAGFATVPGPYESRCEKAGG